MVVSSQQGVAEELQFIPRHSDPDPRLYLDPVSKTVRPYRLGTKTRLARLADVFGRQSFGEESPQKWARDLAAWLRGKRTVSPEKLRWLAQRFERSWIEALNAARYLQHIVVLTGLLLERSPGDAAVVAAFTFRTWLVNEEHQQLLASLDLFGPNLLREDRRGLFERVLMRIERAHAAELWPEVPARVSVSNIGIEELRSVFRLCDPSERRYSPEAGPYPSLAASAASGFLMKRLFAHVVDFSPLGLRSLVEEMLAKESSLPQRSVNKKERNKT